MKRTQKKLGWIEMALFLAWLTLCVLLVPLWIIGETWRERRLGKSLREKGIIE